MSLIEGGDEKRGGKVSQRDVLECYYFTEQDDEEPRILRQEYTVEDAVESIGFGWFNMRIFLVCGLFSATDALEMLLLSVLSPELRCEWMLPEWKVALITTVSIMKGQGHISIFGHHFGGLT